LRMKPISSPLMPPRPASPFCWKDKLCELAASLFVAPVLPSRGSAVPLRALAAIRRFDMAAWKIALSARAAARWPRLLRRPGQADVERSRAQFCMSGLPPRWQRATGANSGAGLTAHGR
jgi:hypothetical protein